MVAIAWYPGLKRLMVDVIPYSCQDIQPPWSQSCHENYNFVCASQQTILLTKPVWLSFNCSECFRHYMAWHVGVNQRVLCSCVSPSDVRIVGYFLSRMECFAQICGPHGKLQFGKLHWKLRAATLQATTLCSMCTWYDSPLFKVSQIGFYLTFLVKGEMFLKHYAGRKFALIWSQCHVFRVEINLGAMGECAPNGPGSCTKMRPHTAHVVTGTLSLTIEKKHVGVMMRWQCFCIKCLL